MSFLRWRTNIGGMMNNNLIEYRGLIEMFKKDSVEILREELQSVKERVAYGFDEIRQILVSNCLKQAIREKEMEG